MKISTRFRYGTRIMAELGRVYPGGKLSVKSLSRLQDVPRKYLEQIMIGLRTAGLVHSSRGSGGGYSLARPPEEITVLEVYEALEGPVSIIDCVRSPQSCSRREECPTRWLWKRMEEAISDVLKGATVADLVKYMVRRRRTVDYVI